MVYCCAVAIGLLTNLRELRVASNRLTALPHELGSLTALHRLVADNNLITSIPGKHICAETIFCSP